MTASYIDLKAKEIARGTTVTVRLKGVRGWVFRLKIATALFWLATKIAGMNYEEEV